MDFLHSAFLLLVLIAFALTLINGINGKVPLWIAVLLVCVALLVQVVPTH
jgi:hypothetical protein